MPSRQRSNPLLGGMDCPSPHIHRHRGSHSSSISEQRSTATLRLLAATALVGMVLLAFAGHHEHQKATQHRVHFQSRRDLAGFASVPVPAPAPSAMPPAAGIVSAPSAMGYVPGSMLSRTGAPASAPAAGAVLGKKGGAAPPAQSKKQGSKGAPATKSTSAPEPGASPGLTAAQSRAGQGSSKPAGKPAVASPKGSPGQPTAQGKKEGKKEPAKHAGAPAPGGSVGHSPAQGKKEGKREGKKEPAGKHAGAPAPMKAAEQKPASGTKGAKKEPAGKHAGAPAPGAAEPKGSSAKGKPKGPVTAHGAKASTHAPAAAPTASAKGAKKGASPSVLSLPGGSKQGPAGKAAKAGPPAFAPAPGLTDTNAASLRLAPSRGKSLRLVSPFSSDQFRVASNVSPAQGPGPAAQAPTAAASLRRDTDGRRGPLPGSALSTASAPGSGAAQALQNKGQRLYGASVAASLGDVDPATPAPAPVPARAAQAAQTPAPGAARPGGFTSFGNIFGR